MIRTFRVTMREGNGARWQTTVTAENYQHAKMKAQRDNPDCTVVLVWEIEE